MPTSTSQPAATPGPGTHDTDAGGRPWGLALLVPLVAAAILTLFVWPALRSAPRGLDIAVVGSAAAAQQVAAALDGAQPGAFDVTAVRDADAARRAVRHRDVVAALVPGDPVTVVTAGAGSLAVAQLAQGAAAALPAAAPAVVQDVAPLPAGDPRGVVLAGGLLPLVIAGLALGASIGLQRTGTVVRLLAAVLGAALSGLLLVAVLQVWLDALGGSYLLNAGAVALAVAAVALPVLGFVALLGPLGIGLAGVIMILLGNALSGAATSPHLLPTGFAQLGQLLPAGATGSLLRSTSGFGGTGATAPALVLAAWAVAGAALAAVRTPPALGR